MQLATARLLLREFTEDDWPAVLAYQSDPRYLRYYAADSRAEAEVRAFANRFVQNQQETVRTKFQLAIVLPDSGQLIGNCGVRLASPDAHQADIGYELAPMQWGQGYASEAAAAIVRFAFEDLRVHRLWASCIADNVASARVLEKLGMQLEGRLRENEQFKGRWWDTLIFGLLDREWQARHGTAQP